jgi:hypothetical protein
MIHELKHYVATPGNGEALRNRFANVTMPIFARLGIQVEQRWEDPSDADGMYYLVSFADAAASAAAWSAFGADAEWKAAKAASETQGPLLSRQSTTVLKPVTG